jgi:O-antigen ligase
MPGLLSMVLAAQVVLFFLVFYRPVWAVASLIVGQITASNHIFYVSSSAVSIRFLWTMFAILVLIAILRTQGTLKLGKGVRRIIIPTIILFTLATVANIVSTDMSYTIEYIRQIVTALVILVIVPAVIKNEKDIKILAIVAIVTCSISAIFALIQHYNFPLPFSSTIFGGEFTGRRAIGLTYSGVHLSYVLPLVILPAISMLILKGKSLRYKSLIWLLVLVMCVALYFTFTRSGMYALGAGAIAMLLVIRSKAKIQLFLIAIILFGAFMVYVDIKGNRYSRGFGEENSAAARLVLWQAGAKIAMDYPLLGIGHNKFKEISEAYVSSVQYDPNVVNAANVLGVDQPHNDFIRVWTSFGTPALIAFLWLLFGIFKNFFDSYRKSSRKFVQAISLGCFAAMAAYIVTAATHNVMDSVVFLWIFGGLSIATCKFIANRKNDTVKVLHESKS